MPVDPPDLRGYVELALEGGFPRPALALRGARTRAAWFESYVVDLLSHDVEELEEPSTKRRDPVRLRRYFEAYALNSAGACEHKAIYEAAQVTKKTAGAYEQLLMRLYVIEQVPAWTSNRLKRLVLQPKRYVVDPALLAQPARRPLPRRRRPAHRATGVPARRADHGGAARLPLGLSSSYRRQRSPG